MTSLSLSLFLSMTLGPLFMFEKVKGTKLCQPRILQVATYIPIIVIETLDPYTYTRQFRLVSFRVIDPSTIYIIAFLRNNFYSLFIYFVYLFIRSFDRIRIGTNSARKILFFLLSIDTPFAWRQPRRIESNPIEGKLRGGR